jgi:glycosyltransferase involved in cell wall biosynthesis
MKILYVIGQLSRGGAEQQLYYLLKYLRPDATVVSLTPGGYWAEPMRALGIEVIELTRRGRGDIARLWRLMRIMRARRPDIVHLWGDNTYGLYGRLAALLTGQKRVIVSERAHPTYNPRWYRIMSRVLFNRFIQRMIANSEEARAYAIQHLGLTDEKALFIPNGLEITRITTEAAIPHVMPTEWQENRIIIGTSASVSPRKNPSLFLHVATTLLNTNPNAHFLWVGGGELEKAACAQAELLGIAPHVRFTGHVNDVPRWLARMDIFVLTSNLEGTPNAVMEAMACALPCVVTDTGGCRELVQDGVTGFVVPVGDADALADRVSCLIDDSALRQRMGEAGKNAIQAYDVHKMAAAYGTVYANIRS